MMTEVLTPEDKLEDIKSLTYKIINTLAFIIGEVIAEGYADYTENCNVPEDKRPIINMKNEFLMKRIMLTANKKNYASIILLQEGKEKNPPELDVKGLAIKKSNVNRNTGTFLQGLLEDKVLQSEVINTSEILTELQAFENKIRESFANGEMTFATPSKVNDIEAYKNPFTIGPLRGVIAWNAVCPNLAIALPGSVNTVKLFTDNLEQLAPLYKTHPAIYSTLKKEIFEHPDLGRYGLRLIAFPKTLKTIPEWLIPFIDVETIIKDNLVNFLPILNSIGVKTLNITADELFYSNIIDF